MVHDLAREEWDAAGFIKELRGDRRRGAIDIHDYIDPEELRKNQAYFPKLGMV